MRFRKAYVHKGGKIEDLKFKAKWFPFGPIMAIVLCIIVLFGSNIWVFQQKWSWFDFTTNYVCIPVFILLYVCYKKVKKTKIISLDDCDFNHEQVDNRG